jgi:hypothetical protein
MFEYSSTYNLIYEKSQNQFNQKIIIEEQLNVKMI